MLKDRYAITKKNCNNTDYHADYLSETLVVDCMYKALPSLSRTFKRPQLRTHPMIKQVFHFEVRLQVKSPLQSVRLTVCIGMCQKTWRAGKLLHHKLKKTTEHKSQNSTSLVKYFRHSTVEGRGEPFPHHKQKHKEAKLQAQPE